MAADQPVANLTIEGDVAVLTLNSPPVNALSQAVREGILNGVKSAVDNPAVKAVVLICDGKTVHVVGIPLHWGNLGVYKHPTSVASLYIYAYLRISASAYVGIYAFATLRNCGNVCP